MSIAGAGRGVDFERARVLAARDRFARLDSVDLRILDILQRDGRTTNQHLAESVRLSPSACLARVRGLEKRGIIAGYGARVAIELIRPTMLVFAEVTMKQHRAETFERFDAFIRGIPEIVEAHRVSAAFDYMMKIVVTDTRALQELSARLLRNDCGVERIFTHVSLLSAKEAASLPLS